MPSPSEVTLEALSLATSEDPESELDLAAYKDRPFFFGNDPIDQLSGIKHLADNARTLLASPTLAKTDVPAIAIGAGPSLAGYLDQIRRLQDRCLIISCDSAFKGLVAAGIVPHLVTPLERHPSVLDMVPLNAGASFFAGTPVCVPEAVRRFDRHLFIPGVDRIYDWCCVTGDWRIAYGSSTGTMAAHVAAGYTTGDIYLVGHDLCYADDGDSHWSGVQPGHRVREIAGYVPGADGTQRPANYWWLRFRKQIGDLASRRGSFINVNAADGRGALIDHTTPGRLPDPRSLPRVNPVQLEETNEERLHLWREDAMDLAIDAERLLDGLLHATCFAETDILDIVPRRNGHCLAFYLQSICAQMSYEVRLGRSREFVLDWFKTAALNAIDTAIPVFREIAHAAA